MKYKGEQSLDILVEIMEPAAAIMADKEVAKLAKKKAPVIKIVKAAIKNHKKEVIEVLAALEGETPEEYAEKMNLLTVPKKLLEILNDPELMAFFTSQGENTKTSSTSATGNTEANEQ